MGGIAGPFLKAAVNSPQAVIDEINRVKKEIQISMFAAGAGDLETLAEIQLLKNNPL